MRGQMQSYKVSDYSRKQIDLNAQHLDIKLLVNQIPKQISRQLSSLYFLWNTIVESYDTRKAQIYTKYQQHFPSITHTSSGSSEQEQMKSRDFYSTKRTPFRPKTVIFSQASPQWFQISLLPTNLPCCLYFILLYIYIFCPFHFFPLFVFSLLRCSLLCYSVTHFRNTS